MQAFKYVGPEEIRVRSARPLWNGCVRRVLARKAGRRTSLTSRERLSSRHAALSTLPALAAKQCLRRVRSVLNRAAPWSPSPTIQPDTARRRLAGTPSVLRSTVQSCQDPKRSLSSRSSGVARHANAHSQRSRSRPHQQPLLSSQSQNLSNLSHRQSLRCHPRVSFEDPGRRADLPASPPVHDGPISAFTCPDPGVHDRAISARSGHGVKNDVNEPAANVSPPVTHFWGRPQGSHSIVKRAPRVRGLQ